MSGQIFQGLIQALTIAAVLGLFKLYKDFIEWKTKTEPLLDWWKQTSLDALKLATNPISERLTELGQKYISAYKGQGKISVAEKVELVEGLRDILNNPARFPPEKLTQASLSLRFIESQEGVGTLLSRRERHH